MPSVSAVNNRLPFSDFYQDSLVWISQKKVLRVQFFVEAFTVIYTRTQKCFWWLKLIFYKNNAKPPIVTKNCTILSHISGQHVPKYWARNVQFFVTIGGFALFSHNNEFYLLQIDFDLSKEYSNFLLRCRRVF